MPTANSTSVKNLQKYGQLTSHGNPPALQYEAQNSGLHEFYADLITGAYSVKYLNQYIEIRVFLRAKLYR